MVGLSFDPHSAYNVSYTDENITIALDLPGVKQDDIQITLEDGTLSIRAQRKERSYAYAWALPDAVNAEAIEAEYENGVLTLTLPKLEAAKLRQIPVKYKK